MLLSLLFCSKPFTIWVEKLHENSSNYTTCILKYIGYRSHLSFYLLHPRLQLFLVQSSFCEFYLSTWNLFFWWDVRISSRSFNIFPWVIHSSLHALDAPVSFLWWLLRDLLSFPGEVWGERCRDAGLPQFLWSPCEVPRPCLWEIPTAASARPLIRCISSRPLENGFGKGH